MGLFSGLEKYGLGKLEKMEVYEQETEREEGNTGKQQQKVVSEEDFLFDKKFSCPVCGQEFHARTIRTGKVKLLSADTDLRPKYQHVDCLKYDAIACPDCGYAALSRFFKFMMPYQVKLIKENISVNFKGLPAAGNSYTYDEAIDRHSLALAGTVVKKAKNSERAYTCLKMAWLYRGKAEALPEDTPDRDKVLEELKQQETELLNDAYTGFEVAYSEEDFPMCGMDENTVTYLLADLARRTDHKEEASRYISRVLIAKDANERIKNKAREIKELLKD